MLKKIINKFRKITGAAYRQVSYAQCGEDLVVQFIADWMKLKKLTYLDIGTNHPKKFNNTYFFYKKGNTGVCVEPDPTLAATIRGSRPKDVCLNVGLSSGEETMADFYVMSVNTLNTFSAEDAKKLDEEGTYKIKEVIKVPLKNINNIIAENFKNELPNFISLDVEGWNEEIVKSFDFSKYRPAIFCIETAYFDPSGKMARIEGIFEHMASNGYSVFSDNQINTVFFNEMNNRTL